MNILIINAHNRENSFCSALAEAYKEGAFSFGHHVQILNLRDMELDKYLLTSPRFFRLFFIYLIINVL